jgi:hypothetical protein
VCWHDVGRRHDAEGHDVRRRNHEGREGMMPGDKATTEKDKAMMDKGGMEKK